MRTIPLGRCAFRPIAAVGRLHVHHVSISVTCTKQRHRKQDISNMLETAGFSKSNPYYIVEQGKVTKITEMSDKLRLELLKEVAGTNVYEEKKDESLKIMKESDAKMAEIIKVGHTCFASLCAWE